MGLCKTHRFVIAQIIPTSALPGRVSLSPCACDWSGQMISCTGDAGEPCGGGTEELLKETWAASTRAAPPVHPWVLHAQNHLFIPLIWSTNSYVRVE